MMEQCARVRGRFAPTPSGRMHLGNLFAALLCWLDVRSQGGDLLLRMEDLDQERCRPEYAEVLADDLRWLGLDWDFGWQGGDLTYLQSRRGEHYEAAFSRLEEQGLVYPCYCTRRERLAVNAPHLSDGSVRYDGRCRRRSAREIADFERQGRKPAFRISVPHRNISFTDGNYGSYCETLDKDCGDFILRRSDGVFAYQLAVVVDDALMGVNRVVRGRDLLSSTPRQLWLFERGGYPAPTYCHTPLLTDRLGRRLSKRERDLDMASLRAHTTPEKLVGLLAYTAGLLPCPLPITARELLAHFSWEKIGQEDKSVGEVLPELRFT